MQEYVYTIEWADDEIEAFRAAYHRENDIYIEFFDIKGNNVRTAMWEQIKKFSRVLDNFDEL